MLEVRILYVRKQESQKLRMFYFQMDACIDSIDQFLCLNKFRETLEILRKDEVSLYC